MKKLIVIALLGLAFGTKAQSIMALPGSSATVIQANGDLVTAGVIKGHIQNDGVIKNASNVQIGSIDQAGTVRNAANVIVGYFMSNYDVHNAANVVIGHLRTTLQVKNAANVQIGMYNDQIPTAWSAVAFFFFQP
jgi:hypothetical protein